MLPIVTALTIEEAPYITIVYDSDISIFITERGFYVEGYYHNESNPIQINLTSIDTLYNVTGFIMGDTYGFSFSGNGVDVHNTGLYQLSGTISFYGGNSGNYDFYLIVDGIEQEDCAIERDATSTSIGNIGMTCLKMLTKGEHLNIQVEDHSIPVQDIYITSMNLNIIEINKTSFINLNVTSGGGDSYWNLSSGNLFPSDLDYNVTIGSDVISTNKLNVVGDTELDHLGIQTAPSPLYELVIGGGFKSYLGSLGAQVGIGTFPSTVSSLNIKAQSSGYLQTFYEYSGSEYQRFYMPSTGDFELRNDGGLVTFHSNDATGDIHTNQEFGSQGITPLLGVHTKSLGCAGEVIEDKANYDVDDEDCVIYCCPDHSQSVQINLLTYSTYEDMHIWVKNLNGAGCVCTIKPYSTDTIDGASNYVLSGAGDSVHIHSEKTRGFEGWWIIGGYGIG